MKLLLCRNISNVGIVGDVVDVSSGYARNFLLPRRLAIEPTDFNIRKLAEARKIAEQELSEQRRQLEALAKRVEGIEVTVTARANEDGVLYGSVGRKEIAAALEDEGYVIQHEHIALTAPIRRLDNVPVEIRFAGDLRSHIKVWVVREKTGDENEPQDHGVERSASRAKSGREAGGNDNERDE